MIRPFDYIRDTFKRTNEQNKELLKFVFEKSDSISLWIIGLAIGGISIFANNIGNIKTTIPACYLKPILILLVISVTCGIIYRTLYLYFFVVLSHTMQGIEISFSRDPVMDTESIITGEETIEELFGAIKNGFGEDHSALIPLYYEKSVDDKKKMRDDFIIHYLNLVSFAQKDTELGFDFVADTYSKFTGKKKEKIISGFKNNSSVSQFLVSKWLTILFYIIYMLSFVLALFLYALAA